MPRLPVVKVEPDAAGDKPPPYDTYAHDTTRSRYANRAESLRIVGGYLARIIRE